MRFLAVVDALLALVSRLGSWGYAVVFVGATLEASAFLGMLVPGDTIAILAGFLAYLGILELRETVAVAAAGAVLGDSIGYELGRRRGRPWLDRHGRRFGLGHARLARIDRLFDRHGGKTVFLARFIGVVRSVAPFVAGASRMPYGRFLCFNVAGGIAWAVGFVLLGYLLGASWWIAERWVGRMGLAVGLLVLGAALALLYRRVQSRAARPESGRVPAGARGGGDRG